MAKHERGCTANPNRVCGVCAYLELQAQPLTKLIEFVRSRGTPEHNEFVDIDWLSVDGATLTELRTLADRCPCCVLAAMRQTSAHATSDANFDFKTELKALWSELGPAAAERRESARYDY